MTTTPILLTVSQFADKHPAFTEASLRWLIFQSTARLSTNGGITPNGLDKAIIRIGRRVLINEEKFFNWVDPHSQDEELS